MMRSKEEIEAYIETMEEEINDRHAIIHTLMWVLNVDNKKT